VGGGFADKIVLLVTLDPGLEKLLGIAVLKSNETPGFGDKIKNPPFKDQFGGCPVQEKLMVVKTGDRSKVDREIVSITGATISSEAVTKIVNDAVREMKTIINPK
jgi:electron transport complex protein RnfG